MPPHNPEAAGSSPAPAKNESTQIEWIFYFKANYPKASKDSKRNERAEQWRRQNRTDAVLVNAAAVKGALTMCATVTASPTPAKRKISYKRRSFFILNIMI